MAVAAAAVAMTGCDRGDAPQAPVSPNASSSASAPPRPTSAPSPGVIAGTQTPADPVNVQIEPADLADLQTRGLSIPVQGIRAPDLRDSFADGRTRGAHEALDIPAPLRTPVFAVEDGVVAQLFESRRGGLTVYQFDPGSRYAYYYAHLDAYAPGLRQGQTVRRCALLGYVGVSGNAPAGAAHLHFAIFKLEADKRWWRGAPLNPYPALIASPAAPCPVSGGG